MYNKKGAAIQEISKILEPVEGEGRKSVVEYVLRRFGISVSSKDTRLDHSSVRSDLLSENSTTKKKDSIIQQDQLQSITDIRAFAELKNPKSITEQVAVVAFYLLEYANESEKTQEFSSEHIKQYFTQARFLSLSTRRKINMALIHTKEAGYIDKVARGKYKLNSKGFNLVKDLLPRGELYYRA